FNTANALGPWLGGMAIAAGYGWTSTGLVGTALAMAGLTIWAIAGSTGAEPASSGTPARRSTAADPC
ncbi:hypothetical protein ACEV7Y_23640, partial [Vibrio parahaemolyticus]